MEERQTHDGGTDERRNEGGRPDPHYLEDSVQEMLRMRKRQPVGPGRNNAVRQSKQAGRRVSGGIIGSSCNSVKKASRERIQQPCNEQANRDQLSMKGKIYKEIIRNTP